MAGCRKVTVTSCGSNTITLGVVSSAVCNVGPFSIPFTTTGTFIGGNTFKVEASNSLGVFASTPPVWGSGTTSPISVIIPVGTATSANYRFRISSTSPAVTSIPTAAVTILPPFNPGSLIPNQTGCTGYNPAPITMATNPTGSGAYNWRWYYWDNPSLICPTGNTLPPSWVSPPTDTRFYNAGGPTNGVGISFDPFSAGTSGRTWALLITPVGTPSCGTPQFATTCHRTLRTPGCRLGLENEELNPDTALTSMQAALEQNIPNPFNEETRITCVVPRKITAARIMVYSMDGLLMESIPVTPGGMQTVTLGKGKLAAGMYFYSLVLDGQQKAVKKMIITN